MNLQLQTQKHALLTQQRARNGRTAVDGKQLFFSGPCSLQKRVQIPLTPVHLRNVIDMARFSPALRRISFPWNSFGAAMALILCWIPNTEAAAPSGASQGWTWCTDQDMTKLDRRVAACTAIIDAARTESGDRAEAYGNRGIAYYNNGDKRQAVKDLQQAIAIEETSASSYRFRGIIHLAERDYAKAFVRFDEAIRREPNNALAFGARGGAFLNNKDFDRAIADYDEALRLDPTFTLALRNRAVAYVEKGDYDRAIADCDSVVRTYADSFDGFYCRGRGYAAKGDTERALADYAKAIELGPRIAATFRARAQLNWRNKAWDNARADYVRVSDLAPQDPAALTALGLLDLRIPDATSALVRFDAAIAADPEYTDAYIGRGEALLQGKDSEQARNELNEAIRHERFNAEAFRRCSLARLGLGHELADAISDCNKALQLRP